MTTIMATIRRGVSALRQPSFNFAALRSLSSSSDKCVGFVGLGNMGLPMCLNLVASKTDNVIVFDTNPEAMAKAEKGGASVAMVLESMMEQCHVIFTMLPGCSAVNKVMETLLLPSPAHGVVFVDCSTVSPSTSRHWSAEAKSSGHGYVDAPVSGGVKGAQNAGLTFMVGLDENESLEKARPYLERMGKSVVLCGGSGTGSATKLCNNLALAAQMVGICEAMNLGESLGVEPAVLAQVMNTSTAKCWSCEVNNPHPLVAQGSPAADNYEGGFGTHLMLKDLGLATTAGQESGIALPQGTLSKELYQLAALQGHGEKDFGVMLKFLRGG